MTDFRNIYNQYFRDVYYFVLSLSHNETIAEEITQETFFNALKNIDKFKGNCKIKVWLFQIAKNTYFSYYNKQKRFDLGDIPKEIVEKNFSDSNLIKDVADLWKRSKVKAFLKGLICATIVCTVIILGYIGLLKWNILSVPTDLIEITDISRLAQGSIAYHVKIADHYELNEEKYSMDEEGNFYITPLRPIIKIKDDFEDIRINNYDFFDVERMEMSKGGVEIKALYYGTPKDNILIWKKGMDLPKANEKVESSITFH